MSVNLKKWLFRVLVMLMATRGKSVTRSENPSRIAIWQFGGIGDMIIGAAVVRDVSAKYPDAKIDVYCSNPKVSAFIKEIGSQVENIYLYDAYAMDSRSMWRSENRHAFRRVLRLHQSVTYDLLINLHIPKLLDWWFFELLLMLRSKAKFTAGFVPDTTPTAVLDRQLQSSVQFKQHYLEMYQELLAPLDINIGSRGYYPVPECEVDDMHAVIHPGASVAFKRWPIENYIELARRLTILGWKVSVVGDVNEQGLGQAIEQALPQVHNVVGKLSLSDMAKLLASANLFIGNDSAPFHLAVAADVPAVGLFGAGPEMYSEYPVPNVKVVRVNLDCAPCFKNACAFNMECMTGLTVDNAWHAVLEVLNHEK